MNQTYSIKERIKYILKSGHKKGYGIHSPYIFNLLNDVIYEKNQYYCYSEIQNKQLFSSNETNNTKHIQLTHRLAIHNKAKTIIEIGTQSGLQTIYLSKTNSKAKIYTIEEQHTAAQTAQTNFQHYNTQNIQLIEGPTNTKLPKLLETIDKIDLLCLNNTQTPSAIIKYYNMAKTKKTNNSIFVIYNPHQTKIINNAWTEITTDPEANITLDLYKIGIVIFQTEIPKQNYTIRY